MAGVPYTFGSATTSIPLSQLDSNFTTPVTIGTTTVALGNTTTTLAGLTSVATNTLTSAAATALTLQSAGSTAIFVDTGQNVGIGTSSPITYTTGTVLAVNSSGAETIPLALVNSNAAANTQVSLAFTPNTNIPLAKISAIRTSAGGLTAMTFGTFSGSAVTEAMRILSGGGVCINTTAEIGSGSPRLSLAFNGTTQWLTNSNDTVGQSGARHQTFFSNGSEVGRITTTTTATTYTTSSDYRLKQDIAPMTGALAKVAQLKPVTYKWKLNNSDSDGFIAHELAEVCPNAVTGEKDAIDADGNIISQGIDTSFLVATLTAAIQEQQALITTLTARITALENK